MGEITHSVSNSDEKFVTGKMAIRQEQRLEDEIKALTDLLLDSDLLAANALPMYENLGMALSLLTQIASCQWGCQGGDHFIENMLRRFCNSAFASLRLASCGLYDEALGPARGMSELVNLFQVFCLNESYLTQWKQMSPKKRLSKFSPSQVRRTIENSGQKPLISKEVYSKLCENGIHVSPTSIYVSHEYENTLYVGGHFAVPGLFLLLTRLSYTVAPCLALAGKLAKVPEEKKQVLAEALTIVLNGVHGIDVTDYETFMNKFRAEHTHDLVLQELSQRGGDDWQSFIKTLMPELSDENYLANFEGMAEKEVQDKIFPIIYERIAQQVIQKSQKQTIRWSINAARDAFAKQLKDLAEEEGDYKVSISTQVE